MIYVSYSLRWSRPEPALRRTRQWGQVTGTSQWTTARSAGPRCWQMLFSLSACDWRSWPSRFSLNVQRFDLHAGGNACQSHVRQRFSSKKTNHLHLLDSSPRSSLVCGNSLWQESEIKKAEGKSHLLLDKCVEQKKSLEFLASRSTSSTFKSTNPHKTTARTQMCWALNKCGLLRQQGGQLRDPVKFLQLCILATNPQCCIFPTPTISVFLYWCPCPALVASGLKGVHFALRSESKWSSNRNHCFINGQFVYRERQRARLQPLWEIWPLKHSDHYNKTKKYQLTEALVNKPYPSTLGQGPEELQGEADSSSRCPRCRGLRARGISQPHNHPRK